MNYDANMALLIYMYNSYLLISYMGKHTIFYSIEYKMHHLLIKYCSDLLHSQVVITL